MSQSPSGDAAPGSLFEYRRGWSAINTLLDKGASLSGRERNCAYLNLGDGTFTDVSAHCGFDFPDDGRSMAFTDWNHDGKIDMFITNRTAPRIRFLLNQSQTQNNFVAFKLTGKSSNRDAIGARIELVTDKRTTIQTVRAGDGFLAQSSKWTHFGIGRAQAIKSLTVRWPGGEFETFDVPNVGSYYLVSQGTGKAEKWNTPSIPSISPSKFEEPAGTDTARIFMPARVPLPRCNWADFDGKEHDILSSSGKPRLINLWAAWCAPCIGELTEWKVNEKQIRDLGLEIVALTVDELTGRAETTVENAKAKIKALGFPFQTGIANEPLLENLELIADALIDKHNSLPVPSSILLDKNGEVAAIYKGAVSYEDLSRDVKLIDSPREELRFHAAHFPGRWMQQPMQASLSRIVTNFVTIGDIADAEAYLARWVEARNPETGNAPDIAESYYAVAGAFRNKGDLPAAVNAYLNALKYSADQPRIHLDLGIAFTDLRRHAEAVPHLQKAVDANPKDTDTRRRLVMAYVASGDTKPALPHLQLLVAAYPGDATAQLLLAKSLKSNGLTIASVIAYRQALELRPGWPLAANELAWMLATYPDDSVRDGKEALKLALSASKATGEKEPAVLDTVAAAYAETGQIENAIKTMRTAITIASNAQQKGLVQMLESRLKIYESGKPFRDEIK